jgi:chloramphenicol 3-O-phosphotransferase
VHDGLAIAFAECAIEASAVVCCQVVSDEGLAAELVHTLENLTLSTAVFTTAHFRTYFVGGSVSETGEKREESSGDRGRGRVPEDDFVQVRCRLNLALQLDTSGHPDCVAWYLANIAHQPLRRGVDGVKDHELRNAGRSFAR